MSLKESLKWRYAVKKYSAQKVSDANVKTILEAINLSASSAGLQPYRVIVVKNPEIRKQLAEGGFNPQVEEASHLLVFAALDNLSIEHVDDYMQRMADTRGIPVEALGEFRKILVVNITGRTPEENFIWATKQAYIGLGNGLLAAADLRIDATPMEGFDPAKFDEVLGLKEQGLKSVVLLSLGYRDSEKDPYVNAAKVRLPLDEFTKYI
ncbi:MULTISPECIES: NAD(P)H-dependent oxidoreductase [unclassified Sphingobacterium]|uniref:NAD(P)H-dependent oxidoreductase n=1 Tax=unclassified Sphingobacterium TaxID=2609468 RepID=UPI0025E626C1|nr:MULTISPECIES: NAD(P)H-dependent oxidoreductase [unclassified Sphingobacterium]